MMFVLGRITLDANNFAPLTGDFTLPEDEVTSPKFYPGSPRPPDAKKSVSSKRSSKTSDSKRKLRYALYDEDTMRKSMSIPSVSQEHKSSKKVKYLTDDTKRNSCWSWLWCCPSHGNMHLDESNDDAVAELNPKPKADGGSPVETESVVLNPPRPVTDFK